MSAKLTELPRNDQIQDNETIFANADESNYNKTDTLQEIAVMFLHI